MKGDKDMPSRFKSSLLALASFSLIAGFLFHSENDISLLNQAKADAVTSTLAIYGSNNSCDDPTNATGMFYRLLTTAGTITNGEVYTGVIYDGHLNEYSITFTGRGNDASTGYDKVDLQLPTTFLYSLVVKKETVFVKNNDSSKSFSFDKDYAISFVKKWQAANIAEYKGEEGINTVAILGSNNSCNDPSNATGMFYRLLIPTNLTDNGKTYSGVIYDERGVKYSITFMHRGSKTIDGTAYDQLDLQFVTFLTKCLISKETLFVNDKDVNKAFHFDQNYELAFVNNWKPVTVNKYEREIKELPVASVDSSKAANKNEKTYRFLVSLSTPIAESSYDGVVYDANDESYEITIVNKGADNGKTLLEFVLSNWKGQFILKNSSVFTSKEDGETVFIFDKTYLAVYLSDAEGADISEYKGPISVSLSAGEIAKAVDFDTISFDVPLCYLSGDGIPSYFGYGTLVMQKLVVSSDKTSFSFTLTANIDLDSFIIRSKTLLSSSSYLLPIIQLDQDYQCWKNADGTYTVGDIEPVSSSTFKLGNGRWATTLDPNKEKPYLYLISFDYSCLQGVYGNGSSEYTGVVYDETGTEIAVKLSLLQVKEVVDVTVFRAAIYLTAAANTFSIKKETVFNNNSATSSFPMTISSQYDYAISYSPDSSRILINGDTIGQGDNTNVKPTISYSGETIIHKKAGEAAPLFIVSAKDAFGMDVCVDRIYSEGAIDAKGRLLKGNHTVTFVAVDSYGNRSELEISLIVE